jgi:predicted RNase H-like HicB family nuclease
MKKVIDYIIWREDEFYVSKCLNTEVSSFGKTKREALEMLKEAMELYFEDEQLEFNELEEMEVGKEEVDA